MSPQNSMEKKFPYALPEKDMEEPQISMIYPGRGHGKNYT